MQNRVLPRDPLGQQTGRGRSAYEHGRVRGAVRARVCVHGPLQPPGSLAEAGDRVEPLRVAQHTIGGETEQETECPGQAETGPGTARRTASPARIRQAHPQQSARCPAVIG
ncbi:hypothetical protein GCM10009804_09390 [Kribbella hippodromi]|uniref:Uncharacterized protein n=1 Tax=Kribbella hippodromi TaxID=434347 RepID=A0ABP4N4N0_9ACTN